MKIDGNAFRVMGNYAVDQIAKFIDEFPDEFYPTMRIVTKMGTVVVGFEEKTSEDEGEED